MRRHVKIQTIKGNEDKVDGVEVVREKANRWAFDGYPECHHRNDKYKNVDERILSESIKPREDTTSPLTGGPQSLEKTNTGQPPWWRWWSEPKGQRDQLFDVGPEAGEYGNEHGHASGSGVPHFNDSVRDGKIVERIQR